MVSCLSSSRCSALARRATIARSSSPSCAPAGEEDDESGPAADADAEREEAGPPGPLEAEEAVVGLGAQCMDTSASRRRVCRSSVDTASRMEASFPLDPQPCTSWPPPSPCGLSPLSGHAVAAPGESSELAGTGPVAEPGEGGGSSRARARPLHVRATTASDCSAVPSAATMACRLDSGSWNLRASPTQGQGGQVGRCASY